MNQITIYTTPTCAYCKLAKNFFQEKKLSYQEIDVSKEQDKAVEMVEKSGQMGVPVIDINGKIIVGFDQEKIEAAIKE